MVKKPLAGVRSDPTGEASFGRYPFTRKEITAIAGALAEPLWMMNRRWEAMRQFQALVSAPVAGIGKSEAEADALSAGDMVGPDRTKKLKPARIPAAIARPVAGRRTGGQIAFTGGREIRGTLDSSIRRSGVYFSSFTGSTGEAPKPLRKWLGRIVPAEAGKTAALASAVYDYGLLVYVPRGVRVEKPLQSLFWMPGRGIRAYRMLIILEDDAQLALFHENAAPDERHESVRLGTVEILVGRNGKLDFVHQQLWGKNIRHFVQQKAVVQKNGLLQWTGACWGSRVSAASLDLDLVGEGATGSWTGLTFLDSDRRGDCVTRQNHLAPRTKSDLSYRAVLAGESRSAWSGMVYVAPGSDQADGYQANRNLMLSGRARSVSRPGLEILTDDVRCSHGVATGALNPEEIFYLNSRGISGGDAARLLVEGFLDAAIEKIPLNGAKDRIRQTAQKEIARLGEEEIPIHGVEI
jgi:Fe-S cluster assembly protein SufD